MVRLPHQTPKSITCLENRLVQLNTQRGHMSASSTKRLSDIGSEPATTEGRVVRETTSLASIPHGTSPVRRWLKSHISKEKRLLKKTTSNKCITKSHNGINVC